MIKIVLSFALILFLFGCSDDPVQPPGNGDPFADCGNGDPSDINVDWPVIEYHVSKLKKSNSTGWWLLKFKLFTLDNTSSFRSGYSLYDPANDELIAAFEGMEVAKLSPAGDRILTTDGVFITTIEIPSFEVRSLRIIHENKTNSEAVRWVSWSYDGSHIYYNRTGSSGQGTYRMRSDLTEAKQVSPYSAPCRAIAPGKFISINTYALVVTDVNEPFPQNRYRSIELPQLYLEPLDELYDVSPDATKLLLQTTEQSMEPSDWPVQLWSLDTADWTPAKIMNLEWWNAEAHPTWSGNGTFYASVYCRKESASMIWEFDLQGNPIRKVTSKGMNIWPK